MTLSTDHAGRESNMLSRASVVVIVLSWWMIAASPAGKAEEPPVINDAKSAAISAKDLAAFQAFRSLVASQSYGLSDDELQGIIEQHVSALDGQPPHAMPAAADLQATTDKRFQQINDSLLRKATQGLDPEGGLGLEKRLREYLDHHDQVRAQFRARYDEYLNKEFPTAVDRVGKRIASEQAKKLREALAGYVAAGKLTAARVEVAFEQGKQEELIAVVVREVLQNCDASWKRSLLVDAYRGFERNVRKAVSNGVSQLQERLDALKAAPNAHTLAGTVKELQARVDAVNDRQTKLARSDSLFGLYVDFPLVQSRIQKAARWHFDRALAAVAQRLVDDLRTGTKRIPDEDRQAIEKEIRNDVRAHHEATSSRELLKSKIDTMVVADRRWIPAAVKTSVETAHSPFDGDFSQQDSQDIDRFLDAPNGAASESWLGLKSRLGEQYGKAAGEARSTIAAEQAEQHAPGLASKAWRPTEKEIGDDSGQQMDPARLRTLSVWKAAPPGDTDVLDETWSLWRFGARTGIEIGKQAMTDQRNVVDRLRDQMADRMRATRGWSTADWINEYSTVAQGEWKENGGSAATDYPALFLATRQRIHAVVIELLGIVAHEREDEATKRAAEPKAQKDAELRDERRAPPPQAEKKDTTRPLPEIQAKDGGSKAPSGGKQSGGGASVTESMSDGKGTRIEGSGAGGPPGTTELDKGRSGTGGSSLAKGTGHKGSGVDRVEETQKTWSGGHYSDGYGDGYGDGYSDGYADGHGHGYGDDPYGLYSTVYPIGFWGLVIIAFIMAGCWYWNIKYLRVYYNARTTEVDPPRQTPNLLRVLGPRRPKESPDSAAG